MVAKVVRISIFPSAVIAVAIIFNACGNTKSTLATVRAGTPTSDQSVFNQFIYNDKPAAGKSFHFEESAQYPNAQYISLGTDQTDKSKVLGAQIVLLLRKDKTINAYYLAYARHQYSDGTFCRIPKQQQYEDKQLYFARELTGTWATKGGKIVLSVSTGTPAKTVALATGTKGTDASTPAINLAFDPGLTNSDLVPLASQKHTVDYTEDPTEDINYWKYTIVGAYVKNPTSLADAEKQLNSDCSASGPEAGVGTMPLPGPGTPTVPATPVTTSAPNPPTAPGTSSAPAPVPAQGSAPNSSGAVQHGANANPVPVPATNANGSAGSAPTPTPSPSIAPSPSPTPRMPFTSGGPLPPTFATPLPKPNLVIKHEPPAVKSALRIPTQRPPLPPTYTPTDFSD